MSEHRKLMELAAKAYWGAEIDDTCSIRWLEKDQAIGYTHGDNQDHNGCDVELLWTPDDDDGDSRRLEVRLGIHMQFAGRFAVAYAGSVHAKQFTERFGMDEFAAARLVVLRAAAEIGRAMP